VSQCWACLVPRLSRSQGLCYCAWLGESGYTSATVPGWAGVGIQVPQLDKSNDCVKVLGIFGTEAEQVAGTVLLCLAGREWVYKCRS
jgi:hypothetical protein